MLKWTPFVMVRICLFFGAGILIGIYLPDSIPYRAAIAVSGILAVMYFISYFFIKGYEGSKATTGIVGLCFVLFVGYVHVYHRTASRAEDHLLHEKDTIQFYEAIVRSAPESKAKSWRIRLEVKRIKTSNWKNASGNVMLYVSKKSLSEIPWMYGDRLLIQGSPNELTPPANPHEFDFKRFLTFRNIYHQQFVLADQVKQLSEIERKGFIYYSLKARNLATSVVNKFIVGEQEQAIAMALIIGVTDGIDTDLQNAYAASGAMHVLAVSGLHVGIIYSILLLLLKPLNRFAWSRWLVFAISIVSLWSFAFVTGLSPSVLRAVTMFSFIALARPLGWKTNIYNTLAGSAFLLLIYDPYLIMSVGFQLSYLAVLGIVYLQKPLYNLWEIENRVGDWIWQITCISIAAQISTFALGMLYFHQFPVYFLISNLFVIPLSTGILIIGIFLLLISAWSFAATWLGVGLTYIIKLLNWLVMEVERWPFSLIEEIPLTTLQCWLIMFFLLGLIFTVEFKLLRWLYASATCALMLVYTQWQHFQQSIDKNQFIVYSVNGHSAWEWISHGCSYFETDSVLWNDRERIRFHIRPNRLNSGVVEINRTIPFRKEINTGLSLYTWHDQLILTVQSKQVKLPPIKKIDYLVISNNSVKPELFSNMNANMIILDGSNSKSYINRCRKSGEREKIHAVLDEGAFVLTN